MSSREQLWTKYSDLDARLTKVTERNEYLVDELRAKEAAAAAANGLHPHPLCIALIVMRLLWVISLLQLPSERWLPAESPTEKQNHSLWHHKQAAVCAA